MFADRVAAGRALADRLEHLHEAEPVVLGLPRGGVVVAAPVAQRLAVPLDVVVVRKLGVPWQPELAMGAIGEDGVRVLNREVIAALGISDQILDEVQRQEQQVLDDRVRRFRATRPRVPLTGRTAVVVDDGVATGSTARAACQVVRAAGAARIVLAVPVGPAGTEAAFADVAEEVVCLTAPRYFSAVGQFYRDFPQTTDDEVVRLLAQEQTGS